MSTEVLTLDPPVATFDAAAGGQSQHAVINQSDQRVAVKVKCSDNSLYRLRPVYSIVEPGTALGIKVTRNPAGAAKLGKILLHYANVSAEEQDAQAPFRDAGSFRKINLPIRIYYPDGESFMAEFGADSHSLKIDPPVATFEYAGRDLSKHAVMNRSDQRVAVKVKCSDSSLFHIKPVFGIVEPRGSLRIKVLRNPGGVAKQDQLVLQYANVSAEEQDAQAPFRAGGSLSELNLPLQYHFRGGRHFVDVHGALKNQAPRDGV